MFKPVNMNFFRLPILNVTNELTGLRLLSMLLQMKKLPEQENVLHL